LDALEASQSATAIARCRTAALADISMNALAVTSGHFLQTAVVIATARRPDRCPGTLDRRRVNENSSNTLRARGLHTPPQIGATGPAEQEAPLRSLVPYHCGKLFWKWPATRYASALKLDSSLCCIPGIKKSNFTRMSIVSFPPAAFRPITPAGFAHETTTSSKKVLRKIFRGKFVDALKQAFQNGQLNFHGDLQLLAQPKIFAAWLRPLFHQHWVVYLKRPFGGPQYVLQYLGRYTHRVAISNHRLVSFADGQVTFRWRDSAHNNEQKLMPLSLDQFLRRFLLHILPQGFVRIATSASSPTGGVPRSYRFAFTFSARHNSCKLNKNRSSTKDSSDLWHCPKCAGR